MIDVSEADIGRKVIYRTAPDFKAEEGVISSFNESFVFVRYGSSIIGSATKREDLEWFIPKRKLPVVW